MDYRIPYGDINYDTTKQIEGWLKSNVGKRAWDGKLNNRNAWDVLGSGYKTFVFCHEQDAILFALKWVK